MVHDLLAGIFVEHPSPLSSRSKKIHFGQTLSAGDVKRLLSELPREIFAPDFKCSFPTEFVYARAHIPHEYKRAGDVVVHEGVSLSNYFY